MAQPLEQEILQNRPFQSLQHEATLNLLRTAAVLAGHLDQVLKPHDLTITTYNILRILKGSSPLPLSCGEIRVRLVTRMPDVTRLLDRMEQALLVTRIRQGEDRRQVHIRLTEMGQDLLRQVDPLIEAAHRQQFRGLNRAQMRVLITLLTDLRSNQ